MLLRLMILIIQEDLKMEKLKMMSFNFHNICLLKMNGKELKLIENKKKNLKKEIKRNMDILKMNVIVIILLDFIMLNKQSIDLLVLPLIVLTLLTKL